MNFKLEDFVYHGMELPKRIPSIKIKDPEKVFRSAFEYFLKIQDKEFVWKDGYDKICSWLCDNKSRGLLIMGECSLGKTFMTRYVIPAILLKYNRIVVRCFELNNDSIDEIKSKKIAIIDDFGNEDVFNEYGTKRMAFSEIVDNAEKNSNLLILTTNLTGAEIKDKYGVRIYERLKSITTQVVVKGEGERK